jgi:hypothetical protein
MSYIQWEYRSDETKVALKQQAVITSSMEMGMRITNKEQEFLCIRESYQQSFLVIGCHV